MPLHEIESAEALKAFLEGSTALVCFSATWCGPCKASKPTLEALADEMENKIKIGIVYEHTLGDTIHEYKVRAFPTYVFFEQGTEKKRVEGVNFEGIREMIAESKGSSFDSAGQSLGGSNLSAREARLARLGAPATNTKDENTDDVEMKDAKADEEAASAKKEDNADATMENAEQCIPVDEKKEVDPTESLDKGMLEQLTSSMGFSLLRAQKGLLNSNGTVEGAIEWLMQHQDDEDIDDPIQPKAAGEARSFKCNECGKILSNMANLELHANKTGHSDFEESTTEVKPLTAEEKAAKIQEIKDLLKAKRAEREEAEKVDNIDREKQRRFMGKEMAKTREEMEREQRKREAQQRKREKDAFKRERERLRAELARDKLERQKNKGKLKSALGADGYNPSIIQYDDQNNEGDDDNGVSASAKKKFKADPSKIDSYIEKVSSYRAGGDGGKCLKILLAYVSNVVNNPEETKFRTINMENKAFKNKVKPFMGAKALLMAVGFQKPEGIGNEVLILNDDADRDTLFETKTKLEKALEKYGK